jgi:transposase
MSVLEFETRQNQAKLIALLSSGMSRRAACKALGIGYTTASNWANEPEFSAALAAECERRQKLIEEILRAAADEQIKSDAELLADELRRYHRVIVESQATRFSIGVELVKKGYRRLMDLPDESLSAADAARLITSGDALVEHALTAWGEALAVDELAKKLGSYQ